MVYQLAALSALPIKISYTCRYDTWTQVVEDENAKQTYSMVVAQLYQNKAINIKVSSSLAGITTCFLPPSV